MPHVQEQIDSEISIKYQLPLMSTRENPTRRYNLEFKAQRSKLPIDRIAKGKLS